MQQTVRSTSKTQDLATAAMPLLTEEVTYMSPTATTDKPVQAPAPAAAAPAAGSKITEDIRLRVEKIKEEQKDLIKERETVIDGAWVARVAQQHFLMLGPGGTAKSFLVRDMVSRITGATLFERALDESSDVSEVLGSPDIKAMVEQGKTRRVLEGTFATATDAFLDEFFNANGVVLHSLQPGLNERIVHNNGQPTSIPLRSAFMGTNKLNADADQAALWDRIHHRHVVKYVADRNNIADMVGGAIARLAVLGRGTGTNLTQVTKVTLEELDQAFNESLALDVPDPVMGVFLDIRDELNGNGILISDRRVVEGMSAVLANAWINGHETVTVGDLDILQHMWWSLQESAPIARGIILGATNPGEKAALDLLDELDKIRAEIKGAEQLDEERKRRVGVEAVRNCDRLLREAQPLLAKATAAGASTARIQETIDKAEALKIEVGKAVFGIDPATMTGMSKV